MANSHLKGLFGLALLLALQLALAQSTEQQWENKTKTKTATVQYGPPITVVMRNLSDFRANVSEATSAELHATIERTFSNVGGNMQVLLANAMLELADAVHQVNQTIIRSNCNPLWDAQDLLANINAALNTCTKDMRSFLDTLRVDANAIVANVQAFVQQLAQLPVICQMLSANPLNFAFANGTNCFVQRINHINKDMALELHRSSLLLAGTREQTRQHVVGIEQCIDNIVAQTMSDLNDMVRDCQ